jgi:hypothetical protein
MTINHLCDYMMNLHSSTLNVLGIIEFENYQGKS